MQTHVWVVNFKSTRHIEVWKNEVERSGTRWLLWLLCDVSHVTSINEAY